MHTLSAIDITRQINNKEVTAEQVAEYFLNRSNNETLGSLLNVLDERVLKQAKEIDKKIQNGKSTGSLAGVPIIIKDNILVEGEITTCGSKILENYRSSFNATVIDRLESEGAFILAKANMDEFAMGSSNANSAFKRCNNPWNESYTPGGSSGGSASSVAERIAPLSLGSDTGGSVRQPAAFCGIYGFKPTYGRVSRNGLVAFASSLDQIGTFATNIDDLALLTGVISGPCKKDSTSIQVQKEDYLGSLNGDIKNLKIGVCQEFLENIDEDIKNSYNNFIDVLKSCGAEIVNITLPHNKYSIPVYYIIAPAEASTNLARFDGVRYGKRSDNAKNLSELYEYSRTEGFGNEVIQRILLGTFVLSSGYQDAYYRKAQKVRSLIYQDYIRAFTKCDAIVFPTTPQPAFAHDSILDPLTMYKQDIFTISANMAGLPAISVPSGFTKKNMPIGMQIQSKQMNDQLVMNIAKAFENKTLFHKQTPLCSENNNNNGRSK